ncbi:MAG: hypothetical protein BJ554DRAFT_611 [Olpidium bornovanus]|uniref:DM10 domain-containing protein n=1 Tax=Olpidium bornovanus TaxID=278681 RepID=A0A8H7ZTQ5_9FUNG|nr:MAG: hypothetical protein BJ554DRAFT_611 [Olpidium bornovanus]
MASLGLSLFTSSMCKPHEQGKRDSESLRSHLAPSQVRLKARKNNFFLFCAGENLVSHHIPPPHTTTLRDPHAHITQKLDHKKQQTLDYRNGYAISQNIVPPDLALTLDDDEVLKALAESAKLQFGLGKRIKGPLQQRGDHFWRTPENAGGENGKIFLPAHVAFDKTVRPAIQRVLQADRPRLDGAVLRAESAHLVLCRGRHHRRRGTPHRELRDPPGRPDQAAEAAEGFRELLHRRRPGRREKRHLLWKDFQDRRLRQIYRGEAVDREGAPGLPASPSFPFSPPRSRLTQNKNWRCNSPSTKNYLLLNEGRTVGSPEPMPVDQYIQSRSRPHRIVRSTPPNDKLRRFLEHDRQVLRFFCSWDDRASMFGELRDFVLHYYLVDDSVEVREVQKPNQGRDPFPVLLRRQKLPKVMKDLSDLSDGEMVHWSDLGVGATIDVMGRKFFL